MRQVQSVKYSKILDQKWLASACIYIWSGTCQVRALMGRALMGRALMGRALVGRALMGRALMG